MRNITPRVETSYEKRLFIVHFCVAAIYVASFEVLAHAAFEYVVKHRDFFPLIFHVPVYVFTVTRFLIGNILLIVEGTWSEKTKGKLLASTLIIIVQATLFLFLSYLTSISNSFSFVNFHTLLTTLYALNLTWFAISSNLQKRRTDTGHFLRPDWIQYNVCLILGSLFASAACMFSESQYARIFWPFEAAPYAFDGSPGEAFAWTCAIGLTVGNGYVWFLDIKQSLVDRDLYQYDENALRILSKTIEDLKSLHQDKKSIMVADVAILYKEEMKPVVKVAVKIESIDNEGEAASFSHAIQQLVGGKLENSCADYTCYCTSNPCPHCTRELGRIGVKRIVILPLWDRTERDSTHLRRPEPATIYVEPIGYTGYDNIKKLHSEWCDTNKDLADSYNEYIKKTWD